MPFTCIDETSVDHPMVSLTKKRQLWASFLFLLMLIDWDNEDIFL